MAEAPEIDPPLPTATESVMITSDLKDDDGPSPKKRKTESIQEPSEKLEQRLGGILCCAVCLDLPPAAVYQCSNGHLMCAPCFTHLLADARLRDESATCPNCRIEISRTSASRNLAVEKTVSELPLECRHCTRVFPRHSIQHHEEKICEDRQYKFTQLKVDLEPHKALSGLVRIVASVYCFLLSLFRRTYLVPDVAGTHKRRRYRRLTGCRYSCIGCRWRGPAHEASSHEGQCAHPHMSAADVLGVLGERERQAADQLRIYTQIFDVLSYEKITFNDLQLKPYRTEEFVHKLYYETLRFPSFGHQWVVKAFVNNQQRDPTQSSQREITYQLVLKSKCTSEVSVQWVWARGPLGEARVRPALAAHTFRDEQPPPAARLPLLHPPDANRLLAERAIHLRLIMFLTTK